MKIDFTLSESYYPKNVRIIPELEVLFGSGEKGHSRVGQKGPIRVE